jgi:hypothetical protein
MVLCFSLTYDEFDDYTVSQSFHDILVESRYTTRSSQAQESLSSTGWTIRLFRVDGNKVIHLHVLASSHSDLCTLSLLQKAVLILVALTHRASSSAILHAFASSFSSLFRHTRSYYRS